MLIQKGEPKLNILITAESGLCKLPDWLWYFHGMPIYLKKNFNVLLSSR